MSRQTRYRYAVTFEYAEQAPETVRGELRLPNHSLAARRAVDGARRQCPGRRPTSISVLLEILETEEGEK